jgi:hypothetical protein
VHAGKSSCPQAISSRTIPRSKSVLAFRLAVSILPSAPHAGGDPAWQRRSSSACSGLMANPVRGLVPAHAASRPITTRALAGCGTIYAPA